MSHFTVLVCRPPEETRDLDDILQPWHEYECTGVKDKWVEWVSEQKEVERRWLEADDDVRSEYGRIEKYAGDYFGYDVSPDTGEFGTWTNPRSKWDWWVIGGRWSGWLNGADIVLRKNLPLDDMRAEALAVRADRVEKLRALVGCADVDELEAVRARVGDQYRDLLAQKGSGYRDQSDMWDYARRHPDRFPLIVDGAPESKVSENAYGWLGGFLKMSQLKDPGTEVSFIEYLNGPVPALTPWALVIPDGHVKGDGVESCDGYVWQEKEGMGWWGMSDGTGNHKAWERYVDEYLESLDGETEITVVDCHI